MFDRGQQAGLASHVLCPVRPVCGLPGRLFLIKTPAYLRLRKSILTLNGGNVGILFKVGATRTLLCLCGFPGHLR